MDDLQHHLSNLVIPTNYNLDVDLVDPTKSNFKANVTIDLVPNPRLTALPSTSTLTVFKLHCSDLVILSSILEFEGDDNVTRDLVVTYNKEHQYATFTLEEGVILTSDSQFRLNIDYIGRIRQVNTFKDKTIGLFKSNFMDSDSERASSDNYVLATHAQPEFARRIFPCLDEPAIKTTFSLTIRTLKRFNCVSCSCIQSIREDNELGANVKIVFFKKTELMPTSLFGFAVGDLKFIKGETESGLPITIYSPMRPQDASLVMDSIQRYLPLLEKFFCSQFPVNKLDVVLLPFLSDVVMENFGMITAQMDAFLLSKETLADRRSRDQMVQIIVHELVHQWIGNYVSFGSWGDLPFNEAFATWLAYDLLSVDSLNSKGDGNHWLSDAYVLNELDDIMLQDSDPTQSKSIAQRCNPHTFNSKRDRLHNLSTEALFDPIAYHKLLSVLRSLQLCLGIETFQRTMAAIFGKSEVREEFHQRAIRPRDIFNVMQQQLDTPSSSSSAPFNVTEYFDSWVAQPGFPLISVTVSNTGDADDTKDLQLVLTQQRYFNVKTLDQANNKDSNLIYQVPLLLWPQESEPNRENLVMCSRSMKLDCSDTVRLLNYNSQGYYRVSYESKEFYDEVCNRLVAGNISDLSLFKIFHDISYLIGDQRYQKPIHLRGTFQILNCIASLTGNTPLLHKSLSEGLSILQVLERSLAVYPHQRTSKDIKRVAKELFKRYKRVETILTCTDANELNVISKLISLTRSTTDTKSLCVALHKQIMQGQKNSVPIELVSSVYMTIAQNMKSIKEWKALLQLVKSSSGIASHIRVSPSTKITESEKVTALQNLAITNIGFVREPSLLNKLLNFVATNFAAPGIENSFIGVSYNGQHKLSCPGESGTNNETTCLVRDIVWKWFKLHYPTLDNFCSGSSKRDEYKERLDKIKFTVLQMFASSPGVVENYERYSDIEDIWNEVLRSDESNRVIVAGLSVPM